MDFDFVRLAKIGTALGLIVIISYTTLSIIVSLSSKESKSNVSTFKCVENVIYIKLRNNIWEKTKRECIND